MKRNFLLILAAVLLPLSLLAKPKVKTQVDLWPDGTPVGEWFHDLSPVNVESLGKQYKLTDYGIFADGTALISRVEFTSSKAHIFTCSKALRSRAPTSSAIINLPRPVWRVKLAPISRL